MTLSIIIRVRHWHCRRGRGLPVGLVTAGVSAAAPGLSRCRGSLGNPSESDCFTVTSGDCGPTVTASLSHRSLRPGAWPVGMDKSHSHSGPATEGPGPDTDNDIRFLSVKQRIVTSPSLPGRRCSRQRPGAGSRGGAVTVIRALRAAPADGDYHDDRPRCSDSESDSDDDINIMFS
jgi:hypothetical protein